MPAIKAAVKPGTTIHTDYRQTYHVLGSEGYAHARVNHNAGEYVGPGGVSVNAIENFWSHLKRSIGGTHTSVSPKHLARYVKEFEYRFNRRNRPETMLPELLSTFRPLNG